MIEIGKALLLGWLLAMAVACSSDETATTATGSPALTGIRYLSSATGSDAGFARALEPRSFAFPADHGSHPDFRTEWWYFTGNVFAANARHFGFELTLFRIGLGPAAPARESQLAANEVWMANLAVTDTAAQRFQAAERLSRGAPGLAGVTAGENADGTPLVIAVEDWHLTIASDRIDLLAIDDGFGLNLELTGLERIVAQGNGGLDPKGPEPGNASYYYSAPRLAVRGEMLSGGNAPVMVQGFAWMDREWSTSALAPNLAGWDWFALQLDDGQDLMFYRLRGNDGSTSAFSGGSLVDARGNQIRLDAQAVDLSATREWTSRSTGVRYPVAWQLAIPDRDLVLTIEPRLNDQELDLTVRYWEGAVSVRGTAGGQAVTGQGYLELAGY